MHEKLNKSNLELNQEIENLEKELEEEKSKQSENDNLVRKMESCLCYYLLKKYPTIKISMEKTNQSLWFF